MSAPSPFVVAVGPLPPPVSGGTVVVGGVRETASLDELRTLALTVR